MTLSVFAVIAAAFWTTRFCAVLRCESELPAPALPYVFVLRYHAEVVWVHACLNATLVINDKAWLYQALVYDIRNTVRWIRASLWQS